MENNEGFLYIDIQNEDSLKKGQIFNMDRQVICPGEIVPWQIDAELFHTEYAARLCYYTPELKGYPVRIYYDGFCRFNISTGTRIYPDHLPLFIDQQLNYHLLDKTKCYYAIVTDERIILTHIMNPVNPVLSIPDLTEDMAFEHHMELHICPFPDNLKGRYLFIQGNGELIQMELL
jgi:hypothetical protein